MSKVNLTQIAVLLSVFAVGVQLGEWLRKPRPDYENSFTRCFNGVLYGVVIHRKDDVLSVMSIPLVGKDRQLKECIDENN